MRETEDQLVYDLDDFLEDVDLLTRRLTEYQRQKQMSLFDSGRFDGVYGIPAGGLVLAVYLHYRLDLPLMLAPTKNTLIVDDIVDSGFTMSHYISKGNFTVALFCKKDGKLKPNIWLREKEAKWIHFPWEGEEKHLIALTEYTSPWEKMEDRR